MSDEKGSSRCRDTMGNTLEKDQWVTVMPPQNTIWIAKIVEISDGGIMLSIDKNQKGVTPAKVRVMLDITLNANPQMPVFPNLCRIVTPQSEEILNKALEGSSENPPGHIVQ
jgi:hypothetical protein